MKLTPATPTELNVTFLGRDDELHVTLRPLPRSSRPTIVVSITADAPIRLPAAGRAERSRFEYFLLRFPYAAVAIRNDLRVALANSQARTLLGREAVRTGALFGAGTAPELRALARRLAEVPAPLPATRLEIPDGRVFRISGIAAHGDDPAVMLIEDITAQEESTRIMSEFLRNAAHQLRTPLTGITSAVEMLQSGAKDRPAERELFLGHIATHAHRLSRLARGLLLLARTDAGESLPVDFVELAPLIEQVAGRVEPQLGVDLRAACPPGLAALAEPDLLQETLAALLENAVTHTREGEVRVTATQSDGTVAVSVADTGPGVLPEFRDRLFEPFFRLTPAGEGYGLGLAIAAKAVAAMRGEIDVSSSPGAGTTFTVRLPAATVVT
jgi:signal transduction histidine kinase